MKVGEGTEESLETRWVGWWVSVCGDYADVVAVCGWDYCMEWEGGGTVWNGKVGQCISCIEWRSRRLHHRFIVCILNAFAKRFPS